MHSLISRLLELARELKRRRVTRVAILYLVAAWGVIEVSNTILPNIGLPQSAVTAVIVLVALGLPVALALAWYFDITPAGVERTASLQRSTPPGPAQRLGRRVLVALSVLLPLTLGMLFVAGRMRPALDDDLVAVMPFRTDGTAPELAVLREGLQVLLSRAINGAGELTEAVEPLRIDRELRGQLGSADEDPDEGDATRIARALGAGRVITGEIVGDSTDAIFNFTVRDARLGRVLLRDALRVHPDSIAGVAGIIAMRVLAADAGVPPGQVPSITTSSPPAMRAYLEGEAARRRGRYAESLAAFTRALELDSTFLAAAMAHLRTSGWVVPQLVDASFARKAESLAWSNRDRLPSDDRLYLTSWDPHYEALSRRRAFIEERERAARRSPGSLDLLFLLADAYFHFGMQAERWNAPELARERFEEIVAIDTAHHEALRHLYQLAARDRDLTSVARWGDRLLAIDSTGGMAPCILDTRARVPEIGRAGRAIRFDTLSAEQLLVFLGCWGPQHLPLFRENDELVQAWRAATGEERRVLRILVRETALLEGRASLVHASQDELDDTPASDALRLSLQLFYAPDSARAAASAAGIARHAASLRPDADPVAFTTLNCAVAYQELAHGRADDAVRRMRAVRVEHAATFGDSIVRFHTSGLPPSTPGEWAFLTVLQVCSAVAEAGAAVLAGRPDAEFLLEAADEIQRHAPAFSYTSLRLFGVGSNDLLAGFWERLGRYDRAANALRRNRDMAPGIHLFDEARLLERAGRADEAARLYAAVIEARPRAEPPFDAEVRYARDRLRALSAERRLDSGTR